MVTTRDLLKIELTREEIISCIAKAKDQRFIDNLRSRKDIISFDCKVRGYVGELAVKKWFEKKSIKIDEINFYNDDFSLDIDLNVDGLNIEIKTSLIPDKDATLERVLTNRDIKLICRNNEPIEELCGDIHIQIYFEELKTNRESFLEGQAINLNNSNESLYEMLQADIFTNKTVIVAWADKKDLIHKINELPMSKRKWTYGKREFWKCGLSSELSKKPIDLIPYLKNK